MKFAAKHLLMHYLIGVIAVKQASSELKTVHSGTNVSFLCPNLLTEPSYIAWFKQMNDSLPVCIVTQYVSEKQADSIYFNGFQKHHIVMSANSTFSSLRIISVNVSDSGIFYCGSFLKNQMVFHNKTQLVVANANKFKEDLTIQDFGTINETSRSCLSYYSMTLILSGLVLLLTVFSIVVLIRLKKTIKHKDVLSYGHSEEENPLQKNHDSDLNYVPIQFAKKNRRHVWIFRDVTTQVVYAATK